MSEVELLPCPFCGGEAALDTFEYKSRAYEAVFCNDCGIKGEGYPCGAGESEKFAIEAWNTRESLERIVEQLEYYSFEHANNANQYEEDGYYILASEERKMSECFNKAIEIVKKGGTDD